MTNYVNRLLKALGESPRLKKDNFVLNYLYSSGKKKWLANILPCELLKRSTKNAINTLMTINESEEFYAKFPDRIETPN